MDEKILNRPNWLGSEVGLVTKTIQVSASDENAVVESDGRKVVPSGTIIKTPYTGLLFGDVDVTHGDNEGAVMIGGRYIDEKLPKTASSMVDTFVKHGLFAFKEGEVVRPDFGGVPQLTKLTIGTISNSSGSLSWSSVSNAIKYVVYMSSTQNGTYKSVAEVTTPAYTAKKNGWYSVKAIGDGLKYADSDFATAVNVTSL